jgi:hypothetical protein
MTIAASCGSAAVDGCRGSATVAAYCASAAITTRSSSVAVVACCGSEAAATPREPSLAAVAMLPAARDTLDEHRLVGTTASDLNTMAGARGARWAPPCERESKKVKPSLVSKMRRVGQRSPTSGWRIPVSSSSGDRRTLCPPPQPLSSQRRAPTPPRRASPPSYAAWRCLLCCLRGSGRGGRRLPPIGESCPPSLSSSSSCDDEYSEVAGEESPSCSRSRNSSVLCSHRSCHRILFSFLRAARSCSRRCAARARSGSGCGRV